MEEVYYMTNLEILAAFEREINKIDDVFSKPATEDSLYWLNQGVAKFTKLRYNGDFVHKTSYEQNDKRRMDLINLYKEIKYTISASADEDHKLIQTRAEWQNTESYKTYTVTYPKDFMYALNEDVSIVDMNNKHKKEVSVFECTADSFMYRIMNSLTDFHYKNHYARPIRIRDNKGCSLLTDGNYKIESYTLGYLRYPDEIKLGDNANIEYKEFPKQVMFEIIKIAAQMYIENQSEQRYNTISNEVNT